MKKRIVLCTDNDGQAPVLKKSVIDFFMSLVLLCVFYRVIFFVNSHQTAMESDAYRRMIFSIGFISDFFVCFILTILIFPIHMITRAKFIQKNVAIEKMMIGLFESLIFLVFLCVAAICFAYQRIFSSLFVGLNYTMISSYLGQSGALSNLVYFINYNDILSLIFMVGIYIAIKFSRRSYVNTFMMYVVLPLYVVIVLYGSVNFIKAPIKNLGGRFTLMYSNPLIHLMDTFLKSFNQYNNKKIAMSEVQYHSVRLVDPSFLLRYPVSYGITTSTHDASWNVVIFVLESVGSAYISVKKSPMPFLTQLAKQGAWFENNYTGGNISVLGQFSIFTGIYPYPKPFHFEMQSNLNIPSIATWLGRHYDSFLVSTSNDSYCAIGLSKTFSEYDNAVTIQPDEKNLFFNMFLDERKGVEFFTNRIGKAKQPFLAIYLSGATHFPYKQYKTLPRIGNVYQKPFERYMNSLSVLDEGIKKTYIALKKKHLLDRTIFIIVGDHGELFGQHGLFFHGNSLFQEEIKVPLLIYAPKLFPAQMIHQVTTSVDILPTLLTALGISYGSALQGESLIRPKHARKYVFVYGDQDDIAAIDQHQKKMLISFAQDTCVTYDLKRDPYERYPLPCNNLSQQEAILKFRNFQPDILNECNRIK